MGTQLEITTTAGVRLSSGASKPDSVIIGHASEVGAMDPAALKVVVYPEPDECAYRQATRTGLEIPVPESAGMETAIVVALAIARGYVSIPRRFARNLATRLDTPPPKLDIKGPQADALSLIAHGHRLFELAALWDVSERQARRRAASIWETLLAETPAQAIHHATRWGVID